MTDPLLPPIAAASAAVSIFRHCSVNTPLFLRLPLFPHSPHWSHSPPRRDQRSPSLVYLFSLFHFHLLVRPVLSLLSQLSTCTCGRLSSCITRMQAESHGCTGPLHLWTPRGANRPACRLNPSLAAWQQDQGPPLRSLHWGATWNAIISHQSNQSNSSLQPQFPPTEGEDATHIQLPCGDRGGGLCPQAGCGCGPRGANCPLHR